MNPLDTVTRDYGSVDERESKTNGRKAWAKIGIMLFVFGCVIAVAGIGVYEVTRILKSVQNEHSDTSISLPLNPTVFASASTDRGEIAFFDSKCPASWDAAEVGLLNGKKATCADIIQLTLQHSTGAPVAGFGISQYTGDQIQSLLAGVSCQESAGSLNIASAKAIMTTFSKNPSARPLSYAANGVLLLPPAVVPTLCRQLGFFAGSAVTSKGIPVPFVRYENGKWISDLNTNKSPVAGVVSLTCSGALTACQRKKSVESGLKFVYDKARSDNKLLEQKLIASLGSEVTFLVSKDSAGKCVMLTRTGKSIRLDVVKGSVSFLWGAGVLADNMAGGVLYVKQGTSAGLAKLVVSGVTYTNQATGAISVKTITLGGDGDFLVGTC